MSTQACPHRQMSVAELSLDQWESNSMLVSLVFRDTMSFATKLCHVIYPDGRAVDVMKHPRTDTAKISLPGGHTLVPQQQLQH